MNPSHRIISDKTFHKMVSITLENNQTQTPQFLL